jgi:hypothetical protein
MQKYDIFESEGGFRGCGGTWVGGPIIRQSPWFKGRAEAEAAAKEMRAADIRAEAEEILAGMAPAELYSAEARAMAEEIKRAMSIGMAAKGRRGGMVRSEAKSAASRLNGKKGGRPKKEK